MVGNLNLKALGFDAALGTFRELAGFSVDSTYYVGTDVHYAAYVEFGTSKMAAQPFLRPAANEVQGNLSKHAKKGNPDQILNSIALEVESKAKRRCPVDTGNLRGSIRTWEE